MKQIKLQTRLQKKIFEKSFSLDMQKQIQLEPHSRRSKKSGTCSNVTNRGSRNTQELIHYCAFPKSPQIKLNIPIISYTPKRTRSEIFKNQPKFLNSKHISESHHEIMKKLFVTFMFYKV